jgi:hypothetical protein
MRACQKCKIEKPESEFYLSGNQWRPCKECSRKQRREYHENHRRAENDAARCYLMVYYDLNKDKVKAASRAYYEAHRAEILIKRKQQRSES